MPELFDPEHREDIEFDLFDSSHDKSQFFKNSLERFKDVDNQFFYAVIYGIMHHRLNGKNITLENAENVLGPKFFIELKKIEKVSMLDHPIFGFFDRCREINNVLSEFGFFLRFYEKRSKFPFQLRQKLKDKNHIKRELSTCIIQKFNGYELLWNHLNSIERRDFIPIDIVYEPTLDEKKNIECFFTPKNVLEYRSTVEKSRKGGKIFNHTNAKQYHYCNNFVIKSDEKMKQHLSICAGKAGYTFSFDNGKIVHYQDHYKNFGDLPFSIYYDFETATGGVFLIKKCMWLVTV